MTRSELEHIIRTAASVAGDREIVVIGSQAILGEYPGASPALLAAPVADIFPFKHPERAHKINEALGEGSRFHEEFGYYAHGISEWSATFPKGWRKRLVRIEDQRLAGAAGLCLEVHDLAISKYVAGRVKDLAFTRLLARDELVDKKELLQRLAITRLTPAVRKLVSGHIERDFRLG